MSRLTPPQRALLRQVADHGPQPATILHRSTLRGCLRRGLVEVRPISNLVVLTTAGMDLVRPRRASQNTTQTS